MGLSVLKSSSSFDCCCKKQINVPPPPLPNPDPNNYKVLRHTIINGILIVKIEYPDCTNYEGRKIMAFECTYEALMRQKKIDPHFSANTKYYSPIARFEPTKRGWKWAKKFAEII